MSVSKAQGFLAAGVSAGLKTGNRKDVALVSNQGPLFAAAAVFTSNRFQAAPVLWSKQVLTDGRCEAVLLNSGGANACTGPEGFADTHRSAEVLAQALNISSVDVAICSTGLIGMRLDMERLEGGIASVVASLSSDGGDDAALAIMTTDTVPKTAVVNRDGVTVGGMAKGAGMLAPALATMLSVLTTDAVVDAETLDRILRRATSRTFDRIDSDGCMSTNDTVMVMASGASGVEISEEALATMVEEVCGSLARQLIADAEGVTKEVRIEVVNAASESDAIDVGRACARSNLLKCAIHGEDPNWGRILSAVGTTQARFEPDAVDVAINGVTVARNGAAAGDRDLVDMKARIVEIRIDLHSGSESAEIWTNDLTAMYVHENSAYSS